MIGERDSKTWYLLKLDFQCLYVGYGPGGASVSKHGTHFCPFEGEKEEKLERLGHMDMKGMPIVM